MDETPIQKFYKNRNVFITGGTGFLGKLLIEKLLRSTDLGTIYLLIREKKGKNMHERIDEIFEDEMFDRLRKEKPKFRHKVEAISGDCSKSGLGLTISDRQTLISKVDIIFHVAATIRLNSKLRDAFNINVNATRDVLDLAKEMSNLKSIIHISTAYSNCPKESIKEIFYEYPVTYEDIRKIVDKHTDKQLEKLTPRIIGEWPNTYSFTKALAESLIKDFEGGLPIGIFRPSIVFSTYKEPLAGWVDNLNGPSGVYFGIMTGLIRVMVCDQDQVADIVTADTVVAGIIACAWDIAQKSRREITIYNYVSEPENRITWREFEAVNQISYKKYPSLHSLWTPFLILTKYTSVFWLLTVIFHIIPALVVDIKAVLSLNKPRSWKFSNENTQKLWRKLSDADKKLFPMSVTTIQWLPCSKNFIRGLRKYRIKDPDSTIAVARKRTTRLNVIHGVLKYGLIFVVCHCGVQICSFYISKIL